MIDCNHLTKRFGSLAAVDDVTFRVDGGICALLGPNGAGKSTLLKMMTGLLAPDQGDVRLFDRRLIGVVPEDLGLFDSLTVREHLELCARVYRLRKSETAERIGGLTRILGLNPARDTFLDRCSHGTRKKTALAMALLHNPRVLFLDEPFEGIDPVAAKTIQGLLSAVSRRGITVFLTSHQLAIVEQLAARILMIREGRIVWDSAIQDSPRSLDDIYFDLVESPVMEDIPWLRSSPS